MEYSKKFNTVKGYFDKKLWNIARVKMAVVKGWITADEFTEITSQPYEEQ